MPYKDPEKQKANTKRYYEANKEVLKAQSRYYHALNKVVYNKRNAERRQVLRKETKESCPEKILWKAAKDRARRNGLEFNLEFSDCIIPKLCPILLIPLAFGNGKAQPNSPSLDRIDNSLGYIKGNVAVISHIANSMKSGMSLEEIDRLHKYVFERRPTETLLPRPRNRWTEVY